MYSTEEVLGGYYVIDTTDGSHVFKYRWSTEKVAQEFADALDTAYNRGFNKYEEE